MPLEIIRPKHSVKIEDETIRKLIGDYIKAETGREVEDIEFHVTTHRDIKLVYSTAYLKDES